MTFAGRVEDLRPCDLGLPRANVGLGRVARGIAPPGETDQEQSRHRAPGLPSDESGQGLRPPKGRTWGRRGHTPVVKVTGSASKRISLAALIAVNPAAGPG